MFMLPVKIILLLIRACLVCNTVHLHKTSVDVYIWSGLITC